MPTALLTQHNISLATFEDYNGKQEDLLTMSRAQERVRRLAQLNQRPLPPAITYGKRRGKRIPLKGDQFLRPDPYDIPVNEDDEPRAASRRVKIGKTYSAKQPNADDSPISEDQLESVYGRDASPLSSPPRRLPPSSRTSDEDQGPLVVKSVAPPIRRRLLSPLPPAKRPRTLALLQVL